MRLQDHLFLYAIYSTIFRSTAMVKQTWWNQIVQNPGKPKNICDLLVYHTMYDWRRSHG